MARRKKVVDEVPQEVVRALARKIAEEAPGYPTQEAQAKALGISQPTISRFKRAIDPVKPKAYRSLTRKLAEQIADRFDTSLEALERGTIHAEAPSPEDMIPNRGLALDFLSGPDFPPDLIVALRKHEPPPDAAGWTRAQWAAHLLWLRKSWEDGHIDLPGAKRPKS